jgi:hypothetical protein
MDGNETMAAAASGASSFAFNFLGDSSPCCDNSNNNEANEVVATVVSDVVTGSANSSTNSTGSPAIDEMAREAAAAPEEVPLGGRMSTRKERLPFAWVDDSTLKRLLVERSREELVYSELLLSVPKTSDDDGGGGDEHDDGTTKKNHKQHQMLRWVDLTRSSYLMPSGSGGSSSTDPNNHSEPIGNVTGPTDIDTHVYEGGGKVWECSCDLVQYLAAAAASAGSSTERSRDDNDPDDDRQGLHQCRIGHVGDETFYVLELGCGHGLPGCYLLREALAEARRRRRRNKNNTAAVVVVFTDYNESVLLDATISNIVLNCHQEDDNYDKDSLAAETTPIREGDCHDADDEDAAGDKVPVEDVVLEHLVLGSGDWLDMSQQLLNVSSSSSSSSSPTSKLPVDGKFDLIVAAETTYTELAARETAMLLYRHLRPNSGLALVATKRYYFGVGGGVDAFRMYAERLYDSFVIETVDVVDNGSGNIREVLRVTLKSSGCF